MSSAKSINDRAIPSAVSAGIHCEHLPRAWFAKQANRAVEAGAGVDRSTLANDRAPTCGCAACTVTHYTFAGVVGVVFITDILPTLVTA